MTFDCIVNMTDINTTVNCANTVSGGYLGIGMLMIVFCVMFLGLKSKGHPTESSIVSSLFITAIISMMVYLFGIVPVYIPAALVVATGFSTAVFVFYGGGE